MKYTSILLLAIFCVSCTSKKSNTRSVLSPNNLPAQYFYIDPSVENTLRTKKGATVRFPANAFKLNGTGKVKVEIKEAYSMKDILVAGLVTESNGQPLSSGGMIYINAQQNDKDVALQITAGVSTPAASYAEGMQLFKGEYNKDSAINWVEPRPLDSTPKQMIERGKQLFAMNCASCHGIDKPAVGPALYGMLKKAPSKAWLNTFIRNWQDAYQFSDSTGFNYSAYTCCVAEYSPTVMNMFPTLSDEDLDALYAFTDGDDAAPDKCAACLEARIDSGYVINQVNEYVPFDWDTTIVNNDTIQFYIPQNTAPRNPAELETIYRKGGFTDQPSSVNYNFTINTLGWYNIDQGYAGLPGTVYVTLTAAITNEQDNDELNIYMVMPSKKNLSVAYEKKAGAWLFDKVNGTIPLHLNEQAYVIAFGQRDGQIVYGIKPFIAQKENTLKLSVSEISEKIFIAHLSKLGLDGLSFSVNRKEKNTGPTRADGTQEVMEQAVETLPENNLKQTAPAAAAGNKTDTVKYYHFIESQGGPCPCPGWQQK